jgi:hypothetical protein
MIGVEFSRLIDSCLILLSNVTLSRAYIVYFSVRGSLSHAEARVVHIVLVKHVRFWISNLVVKSG